MACLGRAKPMTDNFAACRYGGGLLQRLTPLLRRTTARYDAWHVLDSSELTRGSRPVEFAQCDPGPGYYAERTEDLFLVFANGDGVVML